MECPMAPPIAETVQRFLDALAQVESSGDAALVRRALQTILYEAVEQIWAGDAEVAARYLEAMEPAVPRIRAVLASLPEEPMADAARYAQMVMQALRIADRALDSARIEGELTSMGSKSKRDVLRVLYTKGDEQYLSRSDVRKHTSSQAPSDDRIGQILDEFHALHLVTRVEFTRQGVRTAHYRLAPAARELCERLFHHELDTGEGASDPWMPEPEREEYLQRRVAKG
jgi:hypothetical protein